jgi:hypothetical protein
MPADFSADAARRIWPGAGQGNAMAEVARRRPELFARVAARAEAAAAGRFDLLGSGEVCVLDEAGNFRWFEDLKSGATYPADRFYLDLPRSVGVPGSDIKFPWELSRFQQVFWFIWADPARYRDAFLRQWRDWVEANPQGRGVNWTCAMEVALRAVSWTAALACWWDDWDEPTRRAMWAALADHGRFIRDNLEWSPVARNNHYYSDIVGLASIAATLNGSPPADEWMRFAARELRRETLAQFAPDGFLKECTSGYHRFMLELAVLAERACRAGGRPLDAAAMGRLEAAFLALGALGGPAGRMPLIGDNDSGKVFPLTCTEDADVRHTYALGNCLFGRALLPATEPAPEAALLFDAADVPAPAAPADVRLPDRLTDSGVFVLGDGRARLIVHCGPLTYRPVGGHPHLDQLSFSVDVDGVELLVDPGQFCYTAWPDRSMYYRGTSAHNTVMVDDQAQAATRPDPIGYAHAAVGPLRPRCDRFTAGPAGAEFEGRHDGYRRLPGGGDHVRDIAFDAGRREWAIRDRLELTGRHRIRWSFHIHPQAELIREGEAWVIRREDHQLRLTWSGPAARAEHSTGSYSRAYGLEEPAPLLTFEAEASGPVDAGFRLTLNRTSSAGADTGAGGPARRDENNRGPSLVEDNHRV